MSLKETEIESRAVIEIFLSEQYFKANTVKNRDYNFNFEFHGELENLIALVANNIMIDTPVGYSDIIENIDLQADIKMYLFKDFGIMQFQVDKEDMNSLKSLWKQSEINVMFLIGEHYAFSKIYVLEKDYNALFNKLLTGVNHERNEVYSRVRYSNFFELE